MAEHESPCRRVLGLLPKFIEDDFSFEESAEVRDHIGSCHTCRAEHEAMVRLVDTLETLPTLEMPPAFKDAVMRHLPPKIGDL